MSPRLELLRPEVPGADDLEDRMNRPLLLVGISGCRSPLAAPREGLDDDAYRIGDESTRSAIAFSRRFLTYRLAALGEYCLRRKLALEGS